jgi:hypothetical protein
MAGDPTARCGNAIAGAGYAIIATPLGRRLRIGSSENTKPSRKRMIFSGWLRKRIQIDAPRF